MKASALLIPVLLLAGCSVLGSGDTREFTIYSPEVTVAADPAWPRADWSLVVPKPSAPRVVDSPRIAVRPVAGELQIYRGAVWSQPATQLLQNAILGTLEDSGHIPAVANAEAGIVGDYKLILDVRRFEADYAGKSLPDAVIEFNAKLVRVRNQQVIASRTFLAEQAAQTTDTRSVADAFEQALASVTRDVVGWTLQAGQADAPNRR